MMSEANHRFYDDLAGWWPLISPAEDYREEATVFASLLRTARRPVREVLELGSGGGHNALHLSRDFAMTLVDLAAPMLEVSRRLNPECEHVQGDMRTVRLGRGFDAVFVYDAIDYMTTEADLRDAIRTASLHCRPGGVVVLAPDHTVETFAPSAEHGGEDAPDGRGVRYLEWSWDPDPEDTTIRTEYTFTLRDEDGAIEVAHETHTTGLFSRDVWVGLLKEEGLDVAVAPAEIDTREIFIAHRILGES